MNEWIEEVSKGFPGGQSFVSFIEVFELAWRSKPADIDWARPGKRHESEHLISDPRERAASVRQRFVAGEKFH